jgi:hypothetical protein
MFPDNATDVCGWLWYGVTVIALYEGICYLCRKYLGPQLKKRARTARPEHDIDGIERQTESAKEKKTVKKER